MYLAEFKLTLKNRKWYVRRIVEAEDLEEARKKAMDYAKLMTRGNVLWELSYVMESKRPLLLGDDEIEMLIEGNG